MLSNSYTEKPLGTNWKKKTIAEKGVFNLRYHVKLQQNTHPPPCAYDPESIIPVNSSYQHNPIKENLDLSLNNKDFNTFKSCQEAEDGRPRTITEKN